MTDQEYIDQARRILREREEAARAEAEAKAAQWRENQRVLLTNDMRAVADQVGYPMHIVFSAGGPEIQIALSGIAPVTVHVKQLNTLAFKVTYSVQVAEERWEPFGDAHAAVAKAADIVDLGRYWKRVREGQAQSAGQEFQCT